MDNEVLTRSEIVERAAKLAAVSSEFSFMLSKPATAKNIEWRQEQVERELPSAVCQLASVTASRIGIGWDLNGDLFEEEEFDEQFPTDGSFQFNFFETSIEDLEGWEDAFVNWKEYQSDPYPFAFDEIFPVFDVGNGDLIVSSMGSYDVGALFYLDHEGGEEPWKRMANSYFEFVSTLAKLWFPHMELGSLLRFYDEGQKIVSAEGDLARRFDATIASKV